jgi:hypothetical protein
VRPDDASKATISAEKQLDTLHDHYKETHALIRDAERQRDRSFLFMTLLYVVLVFEVEYPANFRGSLGTVTVAGGQLQVGRLPVDGLLDVTWILVLAVVLTYCRTAVHTERQYAYLHRLEDWLSIRLQTPNLYRREGRVYLEGYPVLLSWAWVCYAVVFPVAILIGTIGLTTMEWQSLPATLAHKLFDTGAALIVLISVLLYRVAPPVIQRFPRRPARRGP